MALHARRGRVLAGEWVELVVIDVSRAPAEHRVTVLAIVEPVVLRVIGMRPAIDDGVEVTATAGRIEAAERAGLRILVATRARLHRVRTDQRQPRALMIDQQLILLPARRRAARGHRLPDP